ncbi:DNA-processing protein DprA [Xylocopilactobacillus apicola]|uniref:DNA processing protein DprA n=1 Tax=Xylocopilactobacillus apicola TaxID=2932184 RepID=A0AAU9DAS5_9LACO|nr:DNA-processing protein DprA [Xylocopilactobacillus apicola]BDR58645.1 DNA processing protein DprA [Xylocopilactobacillus apicola]
MKLRDVLLTGFLSRSFTYKNFVALLNKRELLERKELSNHEVYRYSKLNGKNIALFEDFSLEEALEESQAKKIKFLTILDDEYPLRLMESYEPPIVLSYQGQLELLKECCLGIVGGRVYPKNAAPILNNFCTELMPQKIIVVSGLAKGIDAIALKSAIAHQGKTIAVIGTGLNRYYPRENQELQREIARNHLLISEYPPDSGAQKFHFPQRNRVIAGISHGVLVASARNHSGSLITGNLALQNNREVFALPGECGDPLYEGSNKLIQAGAKLVLQAEDVSSEIQYYW